MKHTSVLWRFPSPMSWNFACSRCGILPRIGDQASGDVPSLPSVPGEATHLCLSLSLWYLWYNLVHNFPVRFRTIDVYMSVCCCSLCFFCLLTKQKTRTLCSKTCRQDGDREWQFLMNVFAGEGDVSPGGRLQRARVGGEGGECVGHSLLQQILQVGAK